MVTGRDLADNEVLGLGGSPAGTPVGVWDMVWLKPEYTLTEAHRSLILVCWLKSAKLPL